MYDKTPVLVHAFDTVGVGRGKTCCQLLYFLFCYSCVRKYKATTLKVCSVVFCTLTHESLQYLCVQAIGGWLRWH